MNADLKLGSSRRFPVYRGNPSCGVYPLCHLRWVALTRFIGDGRVEIHNNAAERALRCVAVGRRNYLSAGSDAGGERAAAIYSLIGTAKLHGLDSGAYLWYLIANTTEHRITKVAERLLWNVEAKLPRLTRDTTEI